MREKTHSASTQLKGTGAFEGTVTGSHQSVGRVGNEPKLVVGRPTIAQTEEGVFHSEEWIAILGLILANCMWLADLLANHLATLKKKKSMRYEHFDFEIGVQIDYDLFIVNKHRGV